MAANDLLFRVARHNFTSFVVSDFDLELMNFGRLGLLIVKGFANLSELNNYRRVTAESATLRLPPQVRPVIISAADFDKLLKEGRSFEEYFEYARQQMYISTEEEVLPPEIFGPSEGYIEEEETVPADTTVSEPEIEPIIPEKEEITPESSEMPEAPVIPERENPAKPAQEVKAVPDSVPQATPAPEKVQQNPGNAKQPAKPAAKPAEKKDSVSTKKDNTKKKVTTPSLPQYPTGREGDDPLLE